MRMTRQQRRAMLREESYQQLQAYRIPRRARRQVSRTVAREADQQARQAAQKIKDDQAPK
jgi:hypothetical protein